MKKVFCLFILMISLRAFSEEVAAPVVVAPEHRDEGEERKSNYRMSGRYSAGPFLVFDCEGQYYACVDNDGSEACREKREKSINKKEKSYPCAPLKKYQDKETCLKKNYEVLEAVAVKRFCFPK